MIKTGYKLFEMRDDGKLFPLFIGKTQETPMNEWVMAENITHHPGFAARPGWHICDSAFPPDAPWLKSFNGTYGSQRGKRFKRVWCEVEFLADIDYTDIVQALPKRCFTDKLPTNGFYNWRESGGRLWVIADRIKIIRIITEEERQKILLDMGYDEEAAFEKYRKAMAKRIKTA